MMKKLIFVLETLLICTGISAQNITISFQPVSGNPAIDSVLVTNLQSGLKVKLSGSESLILQRQVSSPSLQHPYDGEAELFPVPSGGFSELSFSASSLEEVTIGLYESSGRLLSRMTMQLSPGWHRFGISFPDPGVYMDTLLKNGGVRTFKTVNTGSSAGKGSIAYRGIGEVPSRPSAFEYKAATFEKTMPWVTGDVLHCSAFSVRNNTIITDSPVASRIYTVEFVTCKDVENNNYPAVKIGSQWWMGKSLLTIKYRNGNPIALVTGNTAWAGQSAGACCYYNNDAANGKMYGALYNWYAVEDARGICPDGWHVPTDAEWTTMENWLITSGYNYDGTLTGNKIAKSLATTSGWAASSFKGAIGNSDYPAFRNLSGFSALPGGGRGENGSFDIQGSWALWWTATGNSASDAWSRLLGTEEINLDRFIDNKKTGYSVRCISEK